MNECYYTLLEVFFDEFSPKIRTLYHRNFLGNFTEILQKVLFNRRSKVVNEATEAAWQEIIHEQLVRDTKTNDQLADKVKNKRNFKINSWEKIRAQLGGKGYTLVDNVGKVKFLIILHKCSMFFEI